LETDPGASTHPVEHSELIHERAFLDVKINFAGDEMDVTSGSEVLFLQRKAWLEILLPRLTGGGRVTH